MARLLGLGWRKVPQGKLKGAEPHQRKALSTRSPPFAPWTNAPLDGVCGVEDERERVATRRRAPPQSPAVCRRTTLPPASRALAPPCRALVRAAGRAGPGGLGPGAGPGPGTVALAWQGGLQPRRPCTALHSMGRRCWPRRALAAACLGAALLLLGAAPRALSPGECPSGPYTGGTCRVLPVLGEGGRSGGWRGGGEWVQKGTRHPRPWPSSPKGCWAPGESVSQRPRDVILWGLIACAQGPGSVVGGRRHWARNTASFTLPQHPLAPRSPLA